MPELPEVEVLRRDLDHEVVGRKIKSVEVNGLRSVRRHKTKKAFISRLEGRKITKVERRGKYLLLHIEGGEALVVHLGMSGQLRRARSVREKVPKHTHVVITFTQGGQLRFVDPRTFGEMFVVPLDEIDDRVEALAHLGIDPLATTMSWNHFGRLVAQRKCRLKAMLMDQKFLAGIGNVYSDEILFAAGLRFDRESDSLSNQEIRRLYRAIGEILQEAVKHRGSSLADQQYVDLFGKPGSYQQHHNVYDREGESCRRCRHTVVRRRFSNRSTFFCEACQI